MSGAAEVLQGEVLPAEDIADLAERDEHAERFAALHDAAQQHAEHSVFCAAAAGAVAHMAKAALPHGQFGKWKDRLAEERGISVRTVENYMGLAIGLRDRMLSQPKTKCVSFLLPDHAGASEALDSKQSALAALAMLDPSKAMDLHAEALREAVSEIANGASLTQLYFDWGIVRKPAAAAPPAAGAGRPKVTMEMRRLAAQEWWQEEIGRLRSEGLDRKTWALCEPWLVAQITGTLTDLRRALKEGK